MVSCLHGKFPRYGVTHPRVDIIFHYYERWITLIFWCVFILIFLIFSLFYVGSMCLMRRLHLARSCVSCLDSSLSDKSFLMLSNHLRFGLPLLLFPDTSIAIPLLPTYSSSLLSTCPYDLNLLSCTFLNISPTFVVPLILSFLILMVCIIYI